MITRFTTYINESRESVEDLEILNPDELGKLLHYEVNKVSPDFQFIQDILDVGCPIDARGYGGWTPLHIAAMTKKPELVKLLLSRGAELDARDNRGWTALHIAASDGKLRMVKLLLSLGADIHIKDNDNRTAWDLVIVMGSYIRSEVPELNPNR